ncbi:MAG: penicillin acylase family protein [Bacteroidota bacterium]
MFKSLSSPLLFLACALLFPHFLRAQSTINVANIEIVRDSFGVPHIFSETDAEAVYGIGWAQCEDNFHLMQDNFSFVRNRAGRLMGKDGATLDFLYQLFGVEDFVERRYAKDISPEIERLLQAYSDAVNRYAELHPKEVKRKDLFPITPRLIVGNYVFHFMLMHSSTLRLGKFFSEEFDYVAQNQFGHGSNAFAFSPQITTDGKSYLVGNPHQPVNEMGNFWELSVHSEEGYEFYGATFSVGGLVPSLGANRHLGWTHTTNYQHSADIYRLEMHPTKKNLYQYDGKWIPLEVKHAKLRVKIGGITIPVRKKYYRSVYGPTMRKKSGYYSFKSHVYHNLKVTEQWYKMGKAKNLDEFMAALDIQGLPAQTITYADDQGNIFHLSNFSHPYRDEAYDWSALKAGNTTILPGNTAANNWSLDRIHPVADLPQIKNPDCGYVYNTNNTVFRMTGPGENLQPKDFPANFGLLHSNNIRGKTFAERIQNYERVSFADVRRIREDTRVNKASLSLRNCMNCDQIPRLLATTPELAPSHAVFQQWDGAFDAENKYATAMAISTLYFAKYIRSQFGNEEKDVPEDELIAAMLKAQNFLLKHYGTLEVPLGEVQKAARFDVEMPVGGCVFTLASTHTKPYKKDKMEIISGDSYVFYARFGENGLEELQTVNAFGNSLKEGHPHSTDQTEMYVKQQTKAAELDRQKLRSSGRSYHPK